MAVWFTQQPKTFRYNSQMQTKSYRMCAVPDSSGPKNITFVLISVCHNTWARMLLAPCHAHSLRFGSSDSGENSSVESFQDAVDKHFWRSVARPCKSEMAQSTTQTDQQTAYWQTTTSIVCVSSNVYIIIFCYTRYMHIIINVYDVLYAYFALINTTHTYNTHISIMCIRLIQKWQFSIFWYEELLLFVVVDRWALSRKINNVYSAVWLCIYCSIHEQEYTPATEIGRMEEFYYYYYFFSLVFLPFLANGELWSKDRECVSSFYKYSLHLFVKRDDTWWKWDSNSRLFFSNVVVHLQFLSAEFSVGHRLLWKQTVGALVRRSSKEQCGIEKSNLGIGA